MKILYIIGKSASGKTTICNRKLETNPNLNVIVPYTSRPMRDNEKNGIDYHFISSEEFQEKINNNFFIEYRSYETNVDNHKDTWYYGTPQLDISKDYIGVGTIESARKLIRAYGSNKIHIIYVIVPDNIREERAEKRSNFNRFEWNRRLEADKIDFSEDAIQQLEFEYGEPLELYFNI